MKPVWHIFIRLLLIVPLSILAYYIGFHTYFWLTAFWLFLFVGIILWDILRIHKRAQQDLENFLLAISQHDFATVIPAKVAEDYPGMASAYRRINDVFQEISLSEESSQSFLEVIIEQVGVALVGFRMESGEITLINKEAKELLQKPYIRNIAVLKNMEPRLYKLFIDMDGREKRLLTIQREKEKLKLSVVARELILEGHRYKLFALQNIRSELEQAEIDSWIKLIKVLTHEIKNSAIPISTLSDVVTQRLTTPNGDRTILENLTEEEWNELSTALKTIQRRSKGLVDFIESYGKLTKLPKPEIKLIDGYELVSSVSDLLQPQFDKKNVSAKINIEPGLKFKGDMIQLEQVLINLVKNALEAIEMSSGEINLEAFQEGSKVYLIISDNGKGMTQETLDNIFVPFYTTKHKGTGIGLSVSRQIIRAHHGELHVSSTENNGTTFEIILKSE